MFASIKNLIVKSLVKKGLVYIDLQNISQQTKKPGLMILAKNTYFETQRSFPFSSLNDIRDAVKSDINEYSPIDTDLFFLRKINEIDGKSKVNLWFVKKEIGKTIQKLSPVFILPETYILIFSQDKTPSFFNITKEDNEKLFVYIDEHTGVKSLESKAGPNIMEDFSRMCNRLEKSQNEIIIDSTDLKFFLKKGLFNIPFHESMKFLNKTSYSIEFAGKAGLKYLYIGVLLFFVYMGTTAFLVSQKKNHLESSEKLISKKVGPLMEKKIELEKQIDRLNLLQSTVENYQPKTTLIQAILKTAPKGLLIRRINISGHTLEIEGSAPDASEFIEALAKRSDMVDPRFTSPLIKEKKTDMERFKLIVEYTMAAREEPYENN